MDVAACTFSKQRQQEQETNGGNAMVGKRRIIHEAEEIPTYPYRISYQLRMNSLPHAMHVF